MTAKVVLYIFGFLLIISCNDNDPKDSAELLDTKWSLKQYTILYDGITDVVRQESEDYWVRFMDNGSIESIDACNSCNATFEVLQNDSIRVNGMSCTEKACSGDNLINSIFGTYHYRISNDSLILKRNSTQTPIYPYEYYFTAD